VRGIGLMIGIELVEKDRSPASARRDVIVKKSLDGGLILLPAGDSVIRFVPPLIIKKTEIDKGLEIFENAIRQS
jgi:4-aminobutyrate aminotransferase